MATLQYVEATGDFSPIEANPGNNQRALAFYDEFMDPADGLIVQPPFSDWQDNVRREGKTLYANMLYWAVLRHAYELGLWGITEEDVSDRAGALWQAFYRLDIELPVSIIDPIPYVSLGSLYLVMEHRLLDWVPGQRDNTWLYGNIKRHPIWGQYAAGMPGLATYPDYPLDWNVPEMIYIIRFGFVFRSLEEFYDLLGRYIPVYQLTADMAGFLDFLRDQNHYSDSLYHSQTIGWSASVAMLGGDRPEAMRILRSMQNVARRDGTIQEVFKPTPYLPVHQNALFHSENPFAWGSATIVNALADLDRLP